MNEYVPVLFFTPRCPSNALKLATSRHQKRRFSQRVVTSLFNTITKKRIAVLGFAFKKDTGDTRESPAITIIKHFRAEDAKITIYDPKVPEPQIWLDLTDPTVAEDAKRGASLSLDPLVRCDG